MTGPYETEREAMAASAWARQGRDGDMRASNLADLAAALSGVEVGAWDRAITEWLAGWEPSTVAVVCGLLSRARAARSAVSAADRAIRWSTVAAVSVVALVAAFVSYRHALAVVRAHGEGGLVAQVYPLTIDGLIYAASMVLLDAARRRARPPALAYAALGVGIAATLAANVAAGLAYGAMGAVVAAWPAPALMISYELLMLIIRSGTAPVPASGTALPEPPAGLNGHGHEAARIFAAELSRGEVPGIRRIRRELHIGQPRAQEVRDYLAGATRT